MSCDAMDVGGSRVSRHKRTKVVNVRYAMSSRDANAATAFSEDVHPPVHDDPYPAKLPPATAAVSSITLIIMNEVPIKNPSARAVRYAT